jgi:ribosomal protein L3
MGSRLSAISLSLVGNNLNTIQLENSAGDALSRLRIVDSSHALLDTGWKHPSNVTKSMLGHFSVNGISPKRHIFEFRVILTAEAVSLHDTSKTLTLSVGASINKLALLEPTRSHGVSLTHRSMGSSGPGQGGGSRVYPGKKMAGNSSRSNHIPLTTTIPFSESTLRIFKF